MSETTTSLRRKTASAEDLQSVVRTMKVMAASSIGQYEASVRALADYYRIVELGLGACFRSSEQAGVMMPAQARPRTRTIHAVVFGSDQGLVGQFNEVIADYAIKKFAALPGELQVWAVGERIYMRLAAGGVSPVGHFTVPNSVQVITPLIGKILVETEGRRGSASGGSGSWEADSELHLFYNRPKSGAAYEPVTQRLLPLDNAWRRDLSEQPWPTKNLPEILGGQTTLRALIREYLFVSLFRACSESLASENASRLAAMQRADENIDEILEELKRNYQQIRQSSIDAELFDVISGFNALVGE